MLKIIAPYKSNNYPIASRSVFRLRTWYHIKKYLLLNSLTFATPPLHNRQNPSSFNRIHDGSTRVLDGPLWH